MRQLSLLVIVWIAGCGTPHAEDHAAYDNAKEVLDKESTVLSDLMSQKKDLQEKVRDEMQQEAFARFEQENPRPDREKLGKDYDEAIKTYLIKEWEFEQERDSIGQPNTSNFREYNTRARKATAKVDALIKEQQARVNNAKRAMNSVDSARVK